MIKYVIWAICLLAPSAASAACVPGSACPFTVGETAVQTTIATADPTKVIAQEIFVPQSVNGQPINTATLTKFHFYVAGPVTPTSSAHFALYTNVTVTNPDGSLDNQPGLWEGGSLCMDANGGNGACKPAKPCSNSEQCVTLVPGWNEVPPYIMHGVSTTVVDKDGAKGHYWIAYKLDTGSPTGTTQFTTGVNTAIEEYSEPRPSANTYVFVPNWQVVNGKPVDGLSVSDPNHASFYADFVGVQ